MKKIIVVLGRENLLKDSIIYTQLFSEFKVLNDPSDELSFLYYKVVSFGERTPIGRGFLQRIYSALLKLSFVLKYRDFKGHYFKIYKPAYRDFEYRKAILRYFFSTLKNKYKVILIGRSAGAMIATQLADEFHFEHIICLGYPFKDPEQADDPYRTMHLSDLKTPTTIYQGTQEVYGKPDELLKYELSKNINVIPVDANHDYILGPEDTSKIIRQLKKLLKG